MASTVNAACAYLTVADSGLTSTHEASADAGIGSAYAAMPNESEKSCRIFSG